MCRHVEIATFPINHTQFLFFQQQQKSHFQRRVDHTMRSCLLFSIMLEILLLYTVITFTFSSSTEGFAVQQTAADSKGMFRAWLHADRTAWTLNFTLFFLTIFSTRKSRVLLQTLGEVFWEKSPLSTSSMC